MKKWLFLVFFIPVSVYALTTVTYKTGLLKMGTNYTAKLFCSCLFVMQQTENYCHTFVKVSPQIFSVHVDYTNKTTSSSALFLYPSQAKFLGEQHGCRLIK